MILARASLRHLRRHPWQTGLSVLGIALSVAVVVAIDLASASARRAFLLAAEGVTGRATHQVVGGPAGLDERVFARLVREIGVYPAAPVIEAWVATPAAPGRPLQLLGVDPFSEAPFRPYLARDASVGARGLNALLTVPGTVLLARSLAAELHVAAGEDLDLRVAGRSRRVRVLGLIEPADARSREALASVIVADIATVQELLGHLGRLSRIDLAVPASAAGEAMLSRVRDALPPGVTVVPAGASSAFVGEITRAFTVNLTALSLLALVVGLFLVYQTMTFSVVQRRPTVGMLRALGVSRGEVLGLVLLEALVLGAVATALGLGLGVGLARGLVRLVTRTINDFYFVVVVREMALSATVLAKGAALGLGATLLAALRPALEATGVPPGTALRRATTEARARQAAPRAALAGLTTLGVGVAVLAATEGSLAWSYVGLFSTVLGAALLTPLVTVGGAAAAGPVLGRMLGLPGRMAARGVVRALSRTGVAVAALMVAVATTVAVGIMVGSFRATVTRWLESSLVADVYVASPGAGGRAGAPLDPALVERLARTPGVEAAGTYHAVRVASPLGPTRVVVLGMGPRSHRQLRLLAGRPDAVWPAFEEGGAVIVSEPYAHRHRLGLGATLALQTDRGERRFPIAGIFADFESDQGLVMLSRRTYAAYWDDPAVSSLGLFAAPGTDVGSLVRALRAAGGGDQELVIRSNRALREGSLEVFDRTFAITAVLRAVTTLVAGIGVLSALMALQIERTRELGVLRAQGLTPRELWGLVLTETGLLGAIAGVLAVPVGIGLAVVLVRVINQRAFGWTIELALPAAAPLQAVGLAVVSAVAAGVLPAWRVARTPPAAAIREE